MNYFESMQLTQTNTMVCTKLFLNSKLKLKFIKLYTLVQTYIMSGMKSDFTTENSPPILLDESKPYEAALLSIDLFNSISNITNLNNVLKYSKNNGVTWVTIQLDTGSYELSAISNEIQRLMVINGEHDPNADNPYYIAITANLYELKSIVHISNNSYRIDFNVPNQNSY